MGIAENARHDMTAKIAGRIIPNSPPIIVAGSHHVCPAAVMIRLKRFRPTPQMKMTNIVRRPPMRARGRFQAK